MSWTSCVLLTNYAKDSVILAGPTWSVQAEPWDVQIVVYSLLSVDGIIDVQQKLKDNTVVAHQYVPIPASASASWLTWNLKFKPVEPCCLHLVAATVLTGDLQCSLFMA